MYSHNTFVYIIKSLVSILLLLFVATGCGSGSMSTGSSGSGNGSENGSQASFSSGNIGPDESFSYTFEEEETVEYYCDIHSPDPGMEGTVTVTSGAEISGQDTVVMENTQFNPSQITVAPNTEIVWVNRDNFAHTVDEGNPPTDGDNGGY